MRHWKARLPVEHARALRKTLTPAEAKLWDRLRGRQLGDAKFKRQFRIGETPYVVDFCCVEAQLVIELDGGIHTQQVEADRLRQEAIEEQGYRVIRFENDAVLEHLEDVLTTISREIDSPHPPTPSPASG